MPPIDAWTGIEASRFGLYIHFPYCLAKCPYCDFAVTVAREVPQARFTRALARELALRLEARPSLQGRTLDSVFFGGGTPSLWSPAELGGLLDAIAGAFRMAPAVEVSLEANPEVADAGRFAAFRAAGVNRLSLGVQSFDGATLKTLGRAHDGAQAERAFGRAREAGFENLSLDFIHGVPGQTRAQAVADARRAVRLSPEHLSAYALTVDAPSLAERTPMARQVERGELALPEDSEAVAMADAVREVYEAGGLHRYEVSNHARPGRHSRHNALYWTGGEYLALGPGAAGLLYDEGVDRAARRTVAHRSAERYLQAVEAGQLPEASSEVLSARELFEERLAMGLRLAGGVELDALCQAFGEPVAPRRAEAERLVAGGFARWEGPRLALTPTGTHLHSEIAARLF